MALVVAKLLVETQVREDAIQLFGFLDPAAPRKLMPRLNQLFNRAELTQEEVHILRGIARQMQKRSSSAES